MGHENPEGRDGSLGILENRPVKVRSPPTKTHGYNNVKTQAYVACSYCFDLPRPWWLPRQDTKRLRTKTYQALRSLTWSRAPPLAREMWVSTPVFVVRGCEDGPVFLQ